MSRNAAGNTKRCMGLALAMLLLSSSFSWGMMSVEQERQMRDRLLSMVRAKVQLVTDPEVVQYVADAGRKILDQVKVRYFNYEFFVIKDEGMNAFAMPGGLVFVHTGLLENIDSENELVCVLAHEIGHVQGRHIARRIERMQRVNIASLAVAVAGLFLGDSQASSAILATSSAFSASMALKYSREDEEEADRRAYQWICRAGYDPRGLASVLKKMQKYRWLGTDAIPSYLSTHPGAAQRLTYLEQLWQRHPCPERAREDPSRLRRIQIKVAVLTGDPMVLKARYEKELKASPDDVYLLYGLAQSLLAAREYKDAIAAFKRLVSRDKEGMNFVPDLGKAYYAAGRYEKAEEVLEPYHASHPEDLAASFCLARSYLGNNEPAKALSLLEGLEDRWPEPSAVYFQLGRAMAALGRAGEAHYYFYLHYKQTGNSESAAFHRQEALQLLPPGSDLYKRLAGKNTRGKQD